MLEHLQPGQQEQNETNFDMSAVPYETYAAHVKKILQRGGLKDGRDRVEVLLQNNGFSPEGAGNLADGIALEWTLGNRDLEGAIALAREACKPPLPGDPSNSIITWK